jgi:hypothetical protein
MSNHLKPESRTFAGTMLRNLGVKNTSRQGAEYALIHSSGKEIVEELNPPPIAAKIKVL